MNIFCFEENVIATILNRGFEYYITEHVEENFSKSNGVYKFSVKGGKAYEVEVELDYENNILNSKCNCPYDYEPICKHQVAVFYKLREIKENKVNENVSKKKTTESIPKIPQILENLQKKQLIKIIMDEVLENSNLSDCILLNYSPILEYNQELKNCKSYIHQSYKAYKSYNNNYYNQNYIEDRAYIFINKMKTVLERAYRSSDKFLGVEMSFLVLGQSLNILENYYEYYEENFPVSILVDDSLTNIEKIVTGVRSLEDRKKLLYKLLKKCKSLDLDGWYDCQADIIKICFKLADAIEDKIMLTEKIQEIIEMNYEEYNGCYNDITLKKYQYEFITQYLNKSEIKTFVDKNVQESEFREIAIKNCFDEGDFENAIKYAKDGENNSQSDIKWKEYRYKAYKELGLIEEQKILAKKLIFDGKVSYYEELKSLSNDKNFYENFQEDLQNLKKSKIISYIEIIEIENDIDKIMDFVKNNTFGIVKYAERLVPKYEKDVKEIYSTYLKSIAKKSSNRKDYKSLCKSIKHAKKVLKKEFTDNLIQDLKITYKRKRALLEELDKI